jgi:hypothetical protein
MEQTMNPHPYRGIFFAVALLAGGCSAGVEETRVEALEAESTQLKADLATSQATVADLTTRLEALEGQDDPASAAEVTALDTQLTIAVTAIDEGVTARSALGARLDSAEAATATNTTDISELQAATTGLSSDQQLLAATVATNTSTANSAKAIADVVDPSAVACPDGMVETALVGGFCIDSQSTEGVLSVAPLECGYRGARVCTVEELLSACYNNEATMEVDTPLFGADFVGADGSAKRMKRHSNGQCTTDDAGATGVSNGFFRCCRTKASLVYGWKPAPD